MSGFAARSFWLPVLLVTLMAAVFGSVLVQRGQELRRMLTEQAALQQRLARLKQDNDRLLAQRAALLSSPEVAERVAREDYGFAAPGEKVTDFESRVAPAREQVDVEVQASSWLKLLMWRDLRYALPASALFVTVIAFALLNVSCGMKR